MSGRFTTGAFAAVTLALAACQQAPKLGLPVSAPPPTGPQIEITGAQVVAGRVVANVRISRDGSPLGLEAASALAPAFTLAVLATEPVSNLPAWRSLVLTGGELERLPIAGPETPEAHVLVAPDTRQPGADVQGTLAGSAGEFTYTFGEPLPPGHDPSKTLRVGVWLRAATGTSLTTSTKDFVPSSGPLDGRELVRDVHCDGCHGKVRAHDGSRTGTRICVTCHTYQLADAQTVDPAAAAGATPATNPNPLELGRLVHRIHRGKNLPTLYASSTTAAAPEIGPTSPKPFFPGRNAPVLGRKFSVVGEQSRERVFGQIVARIDNGLPALPFARGVTFPLDYRSCDVCHEGAVEAPLLATEISRRSCQGCHPDVWFGGGEAPDAVHFAHSGGPQANDEGCAKCHVSRPGDAADWVDIEEAHVAPAKSPRFNKPALQIAEVRNAAPGMSPTIVFTVFDGGGSLTALTSATPEYYGSSPVPRYGFAYPGWFEATIAGPPDPDFRSLGSASVPINEAVPVDTHVTPDGKFEFTFKAKLPEDAAGTWIVAMDARRAGYTKLFDADKGAFAWPFTGESLYEPADTALAWITLDAGATLQPRRKIVEIEKCNRCHGRVAYHGSMRTSVDYCAACHTPDRTDWHARPKTAAGDTNLAGTYDGIEERSIHFKVMIHRIHTGGRTGTAELSSLGTYVSYGRYGFRFRDAGEFPGDLSQCTLCHLDGTYRVESVPADAMPTVANETATIRHAGSTAHGADEPVTPPIAAACTSCHATAYALSHASRQTGNGKEQCVSCHGVKGTHSVDKVHRLPLPVPVPL